MGFEFKFSHQFIIVWLSLAAFLHNILMNGANNVIISSLQKEFYLSSRETGVWVSVYDIGSLLSSVLISFASARGSKPRWIAFGMCMLFCGCMITVVPHFIRAAPNNNDLMASDDSTHEQPITSSSDNVIEMCDYTLIINDQNSSSTRRFLRHKTAAAEPSSPSYNETASTSSHSTAGWLPFQPKYLLYAANMINGLSSASMTTITFSYIEDMAPHHLSGIYEGIYYAVGAFGVGVGFMVTSKCLTLYTYLDRGLQLPSWLTTKHPNWIGAWWLPFLIFGFVALIQASVIFIFPRRLHHKSHDNKSHSDEKHTQNGLKQDNEMKDMSTTTTSGPIIEVSNYDDEKSEDESDSTDDNNEEKHMNTLISTLKQTGSLLSINQLGLKSSRQSLNDHDNEESGVKKKFIENGIHSNGHVKEPASTTDGSSLSLIQKSILLLKKPVYLFLITAGALEGLLQNSFLAFASLFLEYQYRLASGSASLILGFLSIPPLMIGGLLSGIIVRRLEGKTSSCLKFLAVLLFVNIFVYAGFIIYCQEPTLINSPDIGDDHSSLFHTTNECNCNAKIFKPVCLEGSNDTVFRSSCSAGCTEYDALSEQYFNCTQAPLTYLLPYNNTSSSTTSGVKYVNYFTNGLCPTTNACTPRLIVSYASIALLMFLNALAFLPYLKVTIGCIDAQDMNSIGLGIKQFFMNAFGTIPGPILFGTVIDATCTFWHKDVNNQSVCKMYNNRQFALGFGLLGIGFKTICFFLIIVSLIFINRQKKK